jgi:hypothetical protein
MVALGFWVCVKKDLTAVPVTLTDIGDVENTGCMTTASDLKEVGSA